MKSGFGCLHSLISIIFPAWKLFDQPGDSYQIFIREKPSMPGDSADSRPSSWWSLQRPPRARGLIDLFFNPTDLHWLYFHRLMNDLCLRITQDSFEVSQKYFLEFVAPHLGFLFQISGPQLLKIVLENESGERTHEFICDYCAEFRREIDREIR